MTIDRRTLLTMGAATAVASLAPSAHAQTPLAFVQPKLPYNEDALAPVISARTVGLHYGKHHKAYFDKLNKLTEGTPYRELTLEKVVVEAKRQGDQAVFNQAAQAWNHVFYWEQFSGGSTSLEGAFADVLARDFGGLDGLKRAMVDGADKVFGTGWVWLAAGNNGGLRILPLQDAGNPPAEGLHPIVGVDVWEHAYYPDYENRRAEHVKAALDRLVDWRRAGERWQDARR